MRFFVPALAVLLAAATAATAAPQRSSNLGVRVTVVRSCAITTNGTQAGASVTCSAGQIAPVITTAVVPAPPAAPAPQSETTTVGASTTAAPPATATARPAVSTPAPSASAVAGDDDADEAAGAESTPDTVRVVTINF